MTGPVFALDLDQLAIQQAVLRYLAQMGDAITRCADAVAQGNNGRGLAIEELSCLQVLAHYLARRLSELGEPAPGPGPAGEREGAGLTFHSRQGQNGPPGARARHRPYRRAGDVRQGA
jgi:hypothetical protein